MIGWLPITIYHRVCDELPASDPYRVCMTAAHFEQTLRYLRDHRYEVLTLDGALQAMESGRGGRSACLTFDDGYADFYTHAFPLLQRYGYPATVFLVSDRIGGTNAWDVDAGLPSAALLSREQVLELAAAGIEFGAHGATHRRLTALSPAEREREIRGSKETLENLLSRPVRFFAYPYIEQDETVRREVEAAGYAAALGGEQLAHERFLLHRIDITRAAGVSFMMRIRGWRHRLQRVRALRAARAAALSPLRRVHAGTGSGS